MKNSTTKARELRKNMTPQERKIWSFLRKRSINNLKFRRQYPIENYIVDFICHEKKLIIEIDGGQHNQERNKEYDINRTKLLESKGFKVIRFWNNEVWDNIEGVYAVLERELLV